MIDSVNGEYRTTDTPLASYLVQEGFDLLIITYEEKPNSKRQATYVFDSSDSKLKDCVKLFNRGEAKVNLAVYEHVRQGLLDRIMRGLP